jgi:hypothetical protein
MKTLTVIAFKDGAVIRKSTKKAGWASVMVMETSLTITNGIIDQKKRLGFLRAKEELINALAPKQGEDLNHKFLALGGKAMKVRVIESITPQFEGQRQKLNPTTKAVIKDLNGNPIYFSTEVVEDSEENHDVRILAEKSVAAPKAEVGEPK